MERDRSLRRTSVYLGLGDKPCPAGAFPRSSGAGTWSHLQQHRRDTQRQLRGRRAGADRPQLAPRAAWGDLEAASPTGHRSLGSHRGSGRRCRNAPARCWGSPGNAAREKEQGHGKEKAARAEVKGTSHAVIFPYKFKFHNSACQALSGVRPAGSRGMARSGAGWLL